MIVGERHIEVAVGRDYSDVPPTRGMYKGNAGSELAVSVRVRLIQDMAATAEPFESDGGESPVYRSTAQQLHARYAETLAAIQMQQQQQQ